MARAGITRRTSVRCGTAGRIPTVSEPGSPTAKIPGGASASVMATATIRGITRGGAQQATTDAAGIRITDGAHGAEPSPPMCTESGATRHIRGPEQLGQIPTPAIMEPPPAAPITTLRRAGPPLRDAVTIRTSTRATPPDIAEEQPTTR